MLNEIPSIHEVFNARSLSTEDLCRTFIVSEHFNKLAASNNTIMIGPRGSGKTTLMRMLQVQSLDIWEHPSSNEFREKIDFSGVFIPTDRVWKTQYDKLLQSLSVNERQLEILQASFTYHVLERLVATLSYRTMAGRREASGFRSANLSKPDESELVLVLSEVWKVEPRVNSLRSLEAALTAKKSEISGFLTRLLVNVNCNENMPEVVVGAIQSILGDSTRLINLYLKEQGGKWVFLFDELELAPESIVQPLVNSMRGGAENVLLKLSLSPYHRNVSITNSPESSMKDQDVSFISLTGSFSSGINFAKELCGNIFRKHDLVAKPIEEYFENPSPMNEHKEFKELADKDGSFVDYLVSQGIEISKLGEYTEKDKRPTIRKIKFVVQLRNYYRKDGARAGRKSPPDLYGGFDNICRAMEYNPRMLIGIMNRFIHHAKINSVIPIHKQFECLKEMGSSFKALLSTIAIENGNRLKIHTIFELLDIVAHYFKDQISGPVFHPEPKGSLKFGKLENESLIGAVGFALNSGAFIADEALGVDSRRVVDIGMVRCRLSHLFSFEYGLLLSSQREIDLSDILVAAQRDKESGASTMDMFRGSTSGSENIE